MQSDDEIIRARVLRAIAANRNPGLHFAGHFLDFEWHTVADGAAQAVLVDGPHCRDADGTMNLVALGILADHVVAAPIRTEVTHDMRLGTIHLQLQFTGASVTGNIDVSSRLLGHSECTMLRQSLSAATMNANGKPVCHASGAYAVLDSPPGVKLGPLPWEHAEPLPVVSLAADQLEPDEQSVLMACDAALTKASPRISFIQHFWGGVPRRSAQGASNRVAIGQQIGNRVGHVQGGALLGLAAINARAAAPSGMALSNVSAWYISPGRGAALRIRSRILHAGRTTAVVRTEIKNATGERVLEAVSNHVARKRV
jgi:acyl-coenzyme A thioesterase PaaI-like protein